MGWLHRSIFFAIVWHLTVTLCMNFEEKICNENEIIENDLATNGWKTYDCTDQLVNKYGTKVIVWFVRDQFGKQQNKRIFDTEKPMLNYSLHGVWPPDQCLCKNRCSGLKKWIGTEESLVDLLKENETMAIVYKQNVNKFNELLDRYSSKITEKYIPTASTLGKSLNHEYKKHYLNNHLDACTFFGDFIENTNIYQNYSLYPHECRFDKTMDVNVIQSYVHVSDRSKVKKWNYLSSCKQMKNYEDPVTGVEYHESDFPLSHVNYFLTSVRYEERLERISKQSLLNELKNTLSYNDSEFDEVLNTGKKQTIKKIQRKPVILQNRMDDTEPLVRTDLIPINYTEPRSVTRADIKETRKLVVEKIRIKSEDSENERNYLVKLIDYFKSLNYLTELKIFNDPIIAVSRTGNKMIPEITRVGYWQIIIESMGWYKAVGYWIVYTAISIMTFAIRKVKNARKGKRFDVYSGTFIGNLFSSRFVLASVLLVIVALMTLSSNMDYFSLFFTASFVGYVLKENWQSMVKNKIILTALFISIQAVTFSVILYRYYYNVVCINNTFPNWKIYYKHPNTLIEPYCTEDMLKEQLNEKIYKQLTMIGRVKDVEIRKEFFALQEWKDFNLKSLNMVIDFYGVPLFVLCFMIFQTFRFVSKVIRASDNERDHLNIEDLEFEKEKVNNQKFSLIVTCAVDFIMLLVVLMVMVIIKESVVLYGETELILGYNSLDNIFRYSAVVAVVMIALDHVIIMLPWSVRDLMFIQTILTLCCLMYKHTEILVLSQAMPRVIEIFYEQIGLAYFGTGMILLYFFIIIFKKNFKFLNVWAFIIEFIAVLPMIKYAMKLDYVVPFLESLRRMTASTCVPLDEPRLALILSIVMILLTSRDLIYRPSKIFKVIKPGTLKLSMGFGKAINIAIDIMFRALYLVSLISIIVNVLEGDYKQSWMSISSWTSVFGIIVFAITVMVTVSLWNFYNSLLLTDFGEISAVKRNSIFIIFSVLRWVLIICVILFSVALVMHFGGFVRRLSILSSLAPFAIVVILFEYIWTMIGSWLSSTFQAVHQICQGDICGEFIIGFMNKAVTLIKFILQSIKITGYFKLVVDLIVAFLSQTDRQNNFNYVTYITEVPMMLVFCTIVIDSLLGFHTTIWNWLVDGRELYRYDRYERRGNWQRVRDQCENLGDGNEEIPVFNNPIRDVFAADQIKETTNNQRYNSTVQGQAEFVGGDPDEPDNYVIIADNPVEPQEQGEVQVNENANIPIQEAIIEEEEEENNDVVNVDDVVIEGEEQQQDQQNDNRRGNHVKKTIGRMDENTSIDTTTKSHAHVIADIQPLIVNNYAVCTDFTNPNENRFKYGLDDTIRTAKGEIIIDQVDFEKNQIYRESTVYAPVKSVLNNMHGLRILRNAFSLTQTVNSKTITQACNALNAIESTMGTSATKLMDIHAFWVRSKINSVRDEMFSFDSWPYLSIAFFSRLIDSFIVRTNIIGAFSQVLPNVVMANIDSVKEVFFPKTFEHDDIVTLDEFMMCTKKTFSQIYELVNSKQYYFLTTKTGKVFITMSEMAASLMVQEEEVGLDCGAKYSVLKTMKTDEKTQVRPFRIQENLLFCTRESVFSSKLELPKGARYLYSDDFSIMIVDRQHIEQVKIENRSMSKVEQRWMLGVIAESVGAVFDHDPTKRGWPNKSSIHIGSCTTIRMEGNNEDLFVLTNYHVVKGGYSDYHSVKFINRQGKGGRVAVLKDNLHALYTMCGDVVSVPLNDLVAFSEKDYALFRINKDCRKKMLGFFTRINQRDPLKCFPVCTPVTSVTNVFQSMSRQLDRTLSVAFNKIRQFHTYMLWNTNTKEFDIWGYTVPGMSGSPIFNITANRVDLIGIHSAVERSMLNMVHTTRIISAEKIKAHAMNFNIYKSGEIFEHPKSNDCEFPCITTRMERLQNNMDRIKFCNGTLDTLELEQFYSNNQWPQYLSDETYILCDNQGDKREVAKRLFKSVYEGEIGNLDCFVSPTLTDPASLATIVQNAAKRTSSHVNGKLLEIKPLVLKENSFSTIVKYFNAIKDGKLVDTSGNKIVGFKWKTGTSDDNKSMFDMDCRYIKDSTWDVRVEFMGLDDSKYIMADDSMVLELIMCSNELSVSKFQQTVNNLVKISRIGKIYVAYWDGSKLIIQEKTGEVVQCSNFDEKVDIYCFTNGNEIRQMEEDEYKRLVSDCATRGIDAVKWHLKELEQLQMLRLDLDKKMDLLRSQVKDFRSTIDYQEKAREFNNLQRKYLEEKKRKEEVQKENNQVLEEIKDQIRALETQNLKKIQDLNIKKQHLHVQNQKDSEKIKAEKERIGKQYDEKIAKRREFKSSVEKEIKHLNELKKKAIENISLQKKIKEREQDIIRVNEEIKNLFDEKSKKVNELKEQRKGIEGEPVSKPDSSKNPENDPKLLEIKNNMAKQRQEIRKNEKEEAEIKEKLKELQIELQKCSLDGSTTFEKEASRIMNVVQCSIDGGEIRWDSVIKELIDGILSYVKLSSEKRPVDEQIVKRIEELENKNVLLQQKIEELENKNLEVKLQKKKIEKENEMIKKISKQRLAENDDLKKRLIDATIEDRNDEFVQDLIEQCENSQKQYLDLIEETKKRTNRQKNLKQQQREKEFEERENDQRSQQEDDGTNTPPDKKEISMHRQPRPTATQDSGFKLVTYAKKVSEKPQQKQEEKEEPKGRRINTDRMTMQQFSQLIIDDVQQRLENGIESNRLSRLISNVRAAKKRGPSGEIHATVTIDGEQHFIKIKLKGNEEALIKLLHKVKDLEKSKEDLSQVIKLLRDDGTEDLVSKAQSEPEFKRTPILKIRIMDKAKIKKNFVKVFFMKRDAKREDVERTFHDLKQQLRENDSFIQKNPSKLDKMSIAKIDRKEQAPEFVRQLFEKYIPDLNKFREGHSKPNFYAGKTFEGMINEYAMYVVYENEFIDNIYDVEEKEAFLLE